jgi:hypothetical protein
MKRKEASIRLAREIPLFMESWMSAWDKATPLFYPGYDTRAKTTVLQMHAVLEAKERVDGVKRIEYRATDSQHLFVVEDTAIIRLKKLDDRHRSRNYPTATSNRIYRQQGLPGFPELPWLTIGAVINTDWTEVTGVYMTFPNSPYANNWVMDVTTGQAKEIDLHETNFDDELDESQPPIFKPRRDIQEGDTDIEATGA